MKIKVFTKTTTVDFWKHRVFRPELIEEDINQWLAQNPRAEIKEIRHDVFSTFLQPQQLIVSIYYCEN